MCYFYHLCKRPISLSSCPITISAKSNHILVRSAQNTTSISSEDISHSTKFSVTSHTWEQWHSLLQNSMHSSTPLAQSFFPLQNCPDVIVPLAWLESRLVHLYSAQPSSSLPSESYEIAKEHQWPKLFFKDRKHEIATVSPGSIFKL